MLSLEVSDLMSTADTVDSRSFLSALLIFLSDISHGDLKWKHLHTSHRAAMFDSWHVVPRLRDDTDNTDNTPFPSQVTIVWWGGQNLWPCNQNFLFRYLWRSPYILRLKTYGKPVEKENGFSVCRIVLWNFCQLNVWHHVKLPYFKYFAIWRNIKLPENRLWSTNKN